MSIKIIWKATMIGVITGVILALFLKGVQAVTGRKVYTLLLNVDYIPIVREYQFPEIIEVTFHIIVSIILCVLLAILYMRSQGFIREQMLWISFFANVIIGFLLYPTTSFSTRTPSITDTSSLFWWIAGHVLYGLLTGWLVQRIDRKKEIGLNQ